MHHLAIVEIPVKTFWGACRIRGAPWSSVRRLEAVNTATNAGASSTTNQGSNYEIPYLLPGSYRITAELAGFKKAVRGPIELRVNDRITVDFILEMSQC